MSIKLTLISVAFLALISVPAEAQKGKPRGGTKPVNSGYNIVEIPPTADMLSGCLPDFAVRAAASTISPTGIVIGSWTCMVASESTAGYEPRGEEFLWSLSRGYEKYNDFNQPGIYIRAINVDEQFVGNLLEEVVCGDSSRELADTAIRGDLAGNFERLFEEDPCQGEHSVAWFINSAGDLAGRKSLGVSETQGYLGITPFRKTRGGETELYENTLGEQLQPQGLTENGTVLVEQAGIPRTLGLWRVDGTIEVWSGDEPAASSQNSALYLSDINDNNIVIGWQPAFIAATGCWAVIGDGSAKVWNQAVATTLPNLQNFSDSYPLAINLAGSIVGIGFEALPCQNWSFLQNEENVKAVLWDNGVAINLNTLIPRKSGVTLKAAVDVSDDGTILAEGYPTAESPLKCDGVVNDVVSGTPFDCHSRRLYLLVPKRR